MSMIEPYGGSSLARRRSRAVARVDAGNEVRLARLDAEAEVQAAPADAVTYVGRRAMQDVALLSQLEQQLALAVPMASGRLAAIADVAALALTDVVADTARRLRRS